MPGRTTSRAGWKIRVISAVELEGSSALVCVAATAFFAATGTIRSSRPEEEPPADGAGAGIGNTVLSAIKNIAASSGERLSPNISRRCAASAGERNGWTAVDAVNSFHA